MKSFSFFFGLFVALPKFEGFFGGFCFVVAEDPSVAAADFVVDAGEGAFDCAFVFFFGDLSDHDDLE